MNATWVLAELRARGVHFEVVGERLRMTPRRAVPGDLRPLIVEHKAELIALLELERRRDIDALFEDDVDATSDERVSPRATAPPASSVRSAAAPASATVPVRPSPVGWARGRPTCASECCWDPRAWRLREQGNGQPGPWTCVVCHPPWPAEDLIERRETARGDRG